MTHSEASGVKLIISLFALMGIFNRAVFESPLKIAAAQEVIIIPYVLTYFSSRRSSERCKLSSYEALDTLAHILTWILIILAIAPLSGIVEFQYGKLFLRLYNGTFNPPMSVWMYLEMLAILMITWYSNSVEQLIERKAVRK